MPNRLAIVVAAAGFGAFLLAFAVVEWTISHQPSHIANNHSADYREQPPQAKDQIGGDRNPTAQLHTQKNANDRKQEGRWYNAFLDHSAEYLLAIITFGLVWLGARQLNDSRALQRAFVAVEPGGIRPFDSSDDPRIACDIIIVNAGNLPARDVRWAIRHTYSTNGKDEFFRADSLPLVEHGIVIAPKGRARKGSDPSNKSVFSEKRDGAEPDRAWLYVWGRIMYHDGFVAGRAINFCHRYNLHGATGFTIPARNARYHEYGNRIDE